MSQLRVTVQWDAPPVEFLHPVARALETAVEGLPGAVGGEVCDAEAVILHVFVEHCAPSGEGGQQTRVEGSARSSDHTLMLKAYPSWRAVSSRPALNTALGRKLKELGLLPWIIVAISLGGLSLMLLSEAIAPKLQLPDPFDDARMVETIVPKLYRPVLLWLGISAITFCYLHLVSAELLRRLACSFDIVVIVGCKLVAYVARGVSRATLLDHWGLLTPQILAIEIALVLALMPLFFVLVCMDAVRFPRSMKIVVLGSVLLFSGLQYYDARFEATLSSQETCLWISCSKLSQVHLAAAANGLVFMSKLVFQYFKGEDFAVIRPRYRLVPREPSGWLCCPCGKTPREPVSEGVALEPAQEQSGMPGDHAEAGADNNKTCARAASCDKVVPTDDDDGVQYAEDLVEL